MCLSIIYSVSIYTSVSIIISVSINVPNRYTWLTSGIREFQFSLTKNKSGTIFFSVLLVKNGFPTTDYDIFLRIPNRLGSIIPKQIFHLPFFISYKLYIYIYPHISPNSLMVKSPIKWLESSIPPETQSVKSRQSLKKSSLLLGEIPWKTTITPKFPKTSALLPGVFPGVFPGPTSSPNSSRSSLAEGRLMGSGAVIRTWDDGWGKI